jgi:hypothetical protein
VRVTKDEKKAKKYVANPLYNQHVVYDENLVGVQLNKRVVTLNKPRYIFFRLYIIYLKYL